MYCVVETVTTLAIVCCCWFYVLTEGVIWLSVRASKAALDMDWSELRGSGRSVAIPVTVLGHEP
jgi:hypothetical protein